MNLFKKAKKGFTLVELVVVIAVIAILSAVSVGAYFGITDSANSSRLEQEAKQIHTAIQAVALAPNDHSSMSKTGLTITDAGKFELAIESNLGIDVALTDEQNTKDPTKPTICFVTPSVSPKLGGGTVYETFYYHNHEIGGKLAVGDILSGECKAQNPDGEIINKDILDNDKSFNLVTSVSEIGVGDKIIIAAKDSNVALSTTQNDNNRGQVEVERNDDVVIINDEVQILEIEAGSVEGSYAFNTGNGYLYAASSSKNYLRTQSEIDDNSSWKIEINEGTAVITAQGTYTRNVIQYNSGSSLFSCYGSASQQDVSIYRFGTYVPCEHDFGDNLDKCTKCGAENPDYVVPEPQHKEVTIEEALAIISDLDDNEETIDFYKVTGTVVRVEPEYAEGFPKIYLTDGTNELQVYKDDEKEYLNLYEGYTATVEGKLKNYKKNNTNIPEVFNYELKDYVATTYSVNIPTFENGTVTASKVSEIGYGETVTFTITPETNYKVTQFTINNKIIELNGNEYTHTVDRDVTISAIFGVDITPETIEFNFNEQGYQYEQVITDLWLNESIYVSFDKGTNSNAPKYYNSSDAEKHGIRLYGSNTMTIHSFSGTITKVEFTFAAGENDNTITPSVGTFTTNQWVGEGLGNEEIIFTIGGTTGNRRIASMKVYYLIDDSKDYVTGLVADPSSINLTSTGETANVSVYGVYKKAGQSATALTEGVTWSSGDENVATVDNGVITATATSTAETKVTAKYQGRTVQINVTVTIDSTGGETGGSGDGEDSTENHNHELSFADTSTRTSYSTSRQVWSNNGITITNNKNTSTNDVGNYYNPARFYQGSDLVFELDNESESIVKIEIVCSSDTYATNLKNSAGDVASKEGNEVTITLSESSNSYTIDSLTAQVRVNSLTIICSEENGSSDTGTGDDSESNSEKTVTYTISSATSVTTSGVSPTNSSADFNNTYTNNKQQITADNSMTLTLSGYDGCTITGITLSMHSNGSKGAGSFSLSVGSNPVSSIDQSNFNSSNWYGNYTTDFVDITPVVTATTVGTGENIVITISASTNSLYCQSFTITYTTN